MHAVLQSLVDRVSRELEGQGEATMQFHPGGQAHKWSMQQVVEHLILTCRMSTRNLEVRLAKGCITRTQSRSFVQWTLQLMLLSFGHHPRGVPPLEETSPKQGLFPAKSGPDLVDQLRGELERLDAALDRCRRRFGMERVAVHPMLGPLRVDQWRRYHVVHGMHHAQQLAQMREEIAPQNASAKSSSAELAKKMPIPVHRSLT